jgi:hypothetical protein
VSRLIEAPFGGKALRLWPIVPYLGVESLCRRVLDHSQKLVIEAAPDSLAPMIRVHGNVCKRGAGLLHPEHVQHKSVPDDGTLVLRHEALVVDARRDRIDGRSVLVDRALRKLGI